MPETVNCVATYLIENIGITRVFRVYRHYMIAKCGGLNHVNCLIKPCRAEMGIKLFVASEAPENIAKSRK